MFDDLDIKTPGRGVARDVSNKLARPRPTRAGQKEDRSADFLGLNTEDVTTPASKAERERAITAVLAEARWGPQGC